MTKKEKTQQVKYLKVEWKKIKIEKALKIHEQNLKNYLKKKTIRNEKGRRLWKKK